MMRDGGSDAVSLMVSDEQLRYAVWLGRGTLAGFVVMVLAFGAYVGGALDPQVPLHALPSIWEQSSARYLAAAGIPTGWGWAGMLQKGDIVNLVGVALLSGCSVVALLAVIPAYARQRNRLFVAVCVLEIAVMALAASDVLAVAH
jgi:hypothetical protein